MSECAKCGEPVLVPGGFDFHEGDLCWGCEADSRQEEIDRLKRIITGAKAVLLPTMKQLNPSLLAIREAMQILRRA